MRKNLPLAQHRVFDRERFLYFHDHVRCRENVRVFPDDLGSRSGVFLIRVARADARPGGDEHAMTALDELVSRRREKANAVFLLLNFFRDADNHGGKMNVETRTSNTEHRSGCFEGAVGQ